jgi:hypothetical protein
MGEPKTPPSVDNHMIGKGVVSIAEFTNGAPGTYNDVGNAPSFEFEMVEQTIEHFSSRSKMRSQDREDIIQVGYTLNFVLDEFAVANLQMFLKASLDGQYKLNANRQIDKQYSVKFVSDNPIGPNMTWEFWKVKLTPNGALSLISEEYATMSFTAKGLEDTENHPESPFFNVEYILPSTTTTTTTTTTTSST